MTLYAVFKFNIFRAVFDRGTMFPGSCDKSKEELKTGRYAHICEGLTAVSIISEDYSETGVCGFYVTKKPMYSKAMAMTLRVS